MESPYIVVVQGPRGSGKSTLIKSLAKHYTRQKITELKGPVVLRANKNVRVCFFECPNSVPAMLDLAKVADLALLVVNASIGFELETFEFISMLQNHGLPCVMGVLTHLDEFKEDKSLRKIKKVMKNKFWNEVYNGAKLFYLSGMKHDLYNEREVHNLSRFISVLKWKPVAWRASHSYALCDRFEYSPGNEEASLYAYIRGTAFASNSVFLPGLGEYPVVSTEVLEDPVPAMDTEKKKTHRTLKQEERVLYAPSCNVGMLRYDKNTGYLNLPDKYVLFTKHEGENPADFTEGQLMVRELQEFSAGPSPTTVDGQRTFDLLDDLSIQVERPPTPEQEDRNVQEIACELKQKIRKTELREYLVDSTIATDLKTLVYGSASQPKRKVVKMNELDSFKLRISPRFTSTEDYIPLLRPRFMAGSDFREALEDLKEEETEPEFTEKTRQRTGIQPGAYVRFKIGPMDPSIFSSLCAENPLLICAINPHENKLGLLRTKLKRHKWNKHILKNKDPLVVSIGWQRFQTLPYFCTEDKGTDRLRLIKYTPKYGFCFMICYGPLLPVSSAFLVLHDINSQEFRVSASGTVLELNHSFPLMKKLKLVGEPFKVFKNTAFVKNMLNSTLEAAKFEGAKIRTVSGIRGVIKKAAREGIGPPGTFRATFEDKLQMSDIVFLRTYYAVAPKKYYNALIDYAPQRLVKAISTLRVEKGVEIPGNPDSEYTPIIREKKSFTPFRVSGRLEEALPFKTKSKRTLEHREPDELKSWSTEREKKIQFFLQRLGTVKNLRAAHSKQKFEEKNRDRERKAKKEEENKHAVLQKRIKIKNAIKQDRPNSH